jgi:hypothetical protein
MNYNINSGYGRLQAIALAAAGPSFGRMLVCMPSTDPNYDTIADIVKSDPDGDVRLFTTVAAAYDAAESNRNDVIMLSAYSSHSLTEMLTVSKNRVHFVGMDMGDRQTGHGTRLVMGVTTAATDIAAVKVTGVRNSFRNIKIESSNTKAESLYALIEAGEYTLYKNCSFLKLTDLDQATAADVVAEGDSTTWIHCEFGAATLKTTAARPTVLVDKIVGSTGMLDNNFINCNFVSYTSADKNLFKVAAAGDGQRYAAFRSCMFINWAIAAGGIAITDAISAPAGSELYILLDANCMTVGCTNIATATTNVGVYINAAVPTADTSGISVNAA